MPKHKKKFIKKENSVTFHLVHRSQQDPLVADEEAPQRVLVPQVKNEKKKNKEEEEKFGIFYDDNYDYLQHLKTVDDVEVLWEESAPSRNKLRSEEKAKKVQLPSSVFASNVEESVGLLNKAAPITGLQLHLDPDIVAAMDEDFDFDDPDNQLEDDFMLFANKEESVGGSDEEVDTGSEFNSNYSGSESVEEDDELGSLPYEFDEVETKSKFTDYSMTSSVIRRNEQLTLLDDRFEKMFEAYEKNEIGPLDCDEIEGVISSRDQRLLDLLENDTEISGALTDNAGLKDKIMALSESTEPETEKIIVEVEKEKWDCESILSSYSNIYNHPTKIIEPRLPRKIKVDKAGMPVDELQGRGGPKLTAKNLATLEKSGNSTGPRSIVSMVSELSQRPKDETPEERRIRKNNLKEYRRERRKERKANTAAFTEEKLRQEKVMLNLRNNLRGVKIL